LEVNRILASSALIRLRNIGAINVLSLHLPLEQGTDGLIDARAVSMMKPGLILINTARGGSSIP